MTGDGVDASGALPLELPGSSEPSEPSEREERSDDLSRKAMERQADDARRSAIAVSLLFLGLALLFVYFLGINAYMIARGEPRPFNIEFDHSLGDEDAAVYSASVVWTLRVPGREGDPAPPPPALHINGVPLQEAGAESSSVQLRTGERYEATFAPSSRRVAGRFEGSLELRRIKGPKSLPSLLSIPVRFAVRDDLLRNWPFVWGYLGFLTLVYLLAQVICRMAFAKPWGKLSLRVPKDEVPLMTDDAGMSPTGISVELRAPLWTALAPWQRSALRLAPLIRRALSTSDRAPFRRTRAVLWFVHSSMGPVLTGWSAGGYELSRTVFVAGKIQENQASPLELLTEAQRYTFRLVGDGRTCHLTWTR